MPPPTGPPAPPSSVPARDTTSNPSSAPKPSVFQMPSSTPIPPLHPYNKPPSSGAPVGTSSALGASGLQGTNRGPASSSSASTGIGGDLRPSYLSGNSVKEERPPRPLGRPEPTRSERERQAAAAAASHTHTSTAPHHHHHHHHHHSHPTQPSTSTAGIASETKPAIAPPRYEFNIFESYEKIKAKRDMLDRQEAERKLPSIQTSPKAAATASIYSRTGMPPSPTDRRAVPSTAAPGSASKPSISPQPAPATIGGARPIPPISSYTSLSRALPSPFDSNRDRNGAQASKNEPVHHRAPSGSGPRPSDSLSSSLSQASPPKPAATVPSSHRGGFGPPLFASSIQRSPVNRPLATMPATDAARDTRPPAASSTASQPPNKQSSTYSGFGGSGPGFYNSSAYYRNGPPFDRAERERSERERADKQRYEMDRLAEVEREREAKRKAGRNEAQAREEQMRAWDRGDRERKEQERQSAAQGGAFPALRFDPWTGKEKKPHPAPDNRAYKAEPPAAQYPPESTSAMQQVAPQREPRPYGYKAESRDFYGSRDKRSRMDMAVEEQAHRRGSMPKSKKRREDEKVKEATYSARDLAKLVTPNVSVPTIANHLISRSEVIVGREIYEGSTWNLGKTATMTNNFEGLILVQVSGKFLGKAWITRVETGWKDAREEPKPDIIDSQRRLWGTTTYTDDSDLVAMLAHDGWIKWSDHPPAGQNYTSARNDDVLLVTVTIAPPLLRYYGQKRNGVTSRAWGNGHDGMSISIKDVKRQRLHTIHSGRSDRKMRMAEAAKQRALVLEDTGKINSEPPVLLCDVGEKELQKTDPATFGKSGFPYTPHAMAEILDPQVERSLHDYDLHLHHDNDVYVLHIGVYDPEIDPVAFEIKQYPPPGDKDSSEARKLNADDLVWVDAGLMVLAPGGTRKGTLYPAETYSWVKREHPSDLRVQEQDAEEERAAEIQVD